MIFVQSTSIYSIYGGLCTDLRTYDHPIDLPTSSHVSVAAWQRPTRPGEPGEPGQAWPPMRSWELQLGLSASKRSAERIRKTCYKCYRHFRIILHMIALFYTVLYISILIYLYYLIYYASACFLLHGVADCNILHFMQSAPR